MQTSPFGDLTASTFAELQDRADRFADALQSGPITDWSPFLGSTQEPLRTPLLYELVKIDLEAGWRRGDRLPLEDYLMRFPELGTIDTLPTHLIFEEYRTRTRFGDRPELTTYRDRFPKQYPQLMQLAREPASWAGLSPTAQTDALEARELGATNVTPSLDSTPNPEPKAEGKSQPTVVLAGGYELFRWLGSGQFGEVWRAKGPGGVEVAVKVVRIAEKPTKKGAAQRELSALELVKNLRHPFLLQTHAFWTEGGKLYIVMDLAECSLRDRLEVCLDKLRTGIPTDELIPLMADAAEGLDFLHSRGVFHRDVKPDNLLMLHNHAKVADFGLAKSLDPGAAVSFAGTPAYMAPEAWRNAYTGASDQFSLAFTYAELRQGRRPVAGDNLVELVRPLRDGLFDLSGMPPAEQEVVAKAMSPNPELRYPSCSAFVAAIAAAVGVGTRRAAPIAPPSPGMGGLSGTALEPSALDVVEWAGSFANLGPSQSAPQLLATNIGYSESQPRLLATNFVAPVTLPPPPVVGLSRTDTDSEELPLNPVQKEIPQPDPEPVRKFPKIALLAGVVLVVGTIGAGLAVLLKGNGTGVPSTAQTTTPSTEKPPPSQTNAAENLGFPLPRPGFIVGPGSTQRVGGRELPSVIRYPLSTGRPVEFRLIQPHDPSVPPFYLMERKAWNRLYQAFAASNETESRGDSMPENPITGLPVSEAAACARWLGGRLPTPAEWDIAAGFDRRDGRDGPTPKGASAAIGIPAPRSVFNDSDISPHGIYDMGGNGREWTRAVLTPDGSSRWVPLATPADGDRVILRGRMFTLRRPLTFADLEAEQTTPQTQFYNVGSPYTGFRVAIDIPAK